jgi:hypothetical protein
MINRLQGASAEVVWDDDTPETIMQKLKSARYLIDMRSDITEPLEEIVAKYYIQKKKQEQQEQQEPEKKNRRFF